ncbi:hypothetical protein [Vibrio parahaemolyticus]|uniref:Cap15 family cyclic dinucleotide receptor domain-containing protein n=1 Tax=Vibrio parahaemolyticus TaxID=670 RepID=UPI0039EA81BB
MISLYPITKVIRWLSVIYVLLVIIIALIVFKVKGQESGEVLSLAGYALSYAVVFELLLLFIFKVGWRYIWKLIPPMNRLLFPDINGEWEAEIDWVWYNTDDSESASIKKGSTKATVVIEQSLIDVVIYLTTTKSTSESKLVYPRKDQNSKLELYYIYESQTNTGDTETRSDHRGCSILKFNPNNLEQIVGNYWTDRNTRGRYTFSRKPVSS